MAAQHLEVGARQIFALSEKNFASAVRRALWWSRPPACGPVVDCATGDDDDRAHLAAHDAAYGLPRRNVTNEGRQ